ncbi:MAG: molybdopterin molybdotransferase MoeA [Desulfobacterales bacterium]|nr:molybdopterin molybdotransferase MoeA [Desulfobacterales bacterium]
MKEFFKVTDLEHTLKYSAAFSNVGTEFIALHETLGRILADDIVSDINLPDFARSTMDGYAVKASSTFGATEESPAYLTVKGTVDMGKPAAFSIKSGEVAKISTGGMLPDGSDSVIMVEYTEAIDKENIEIYRSVAPGQHVLQIGEDLKEGNNVLLCGQKLRPQEIGLLAALGKDSVKAYKKPVIGIISTGDEIIPINNMPDKGRIRDINTYTLSSLVQKAGGIPVTYGIVGDDFDALIEKCSIAIAHSDMVLISGGSSVGTRDLTVEVLSSLPDSDIMVHGISISPGKPTILARAGDKAIWGLPGHVLSAMIVFGIVIRPFIEKISGLSPQYKKELRIPALLSRNISSAQGRIDYIRVRVIEKNGIEWAEPVLGKSGLISNLTKADGLIEIGINTEGLDKGSKVWVIPV